MPKKTITKFSVFVIFMAVVSIGTAACHSSVVGGGEPPPFDRAKSLYEEPKIVGKMESDEITESSGVAVSRCQQNVIWTHNDSGDGPFIFAINFKGKSLGTWQVANARNIDWEDIAGFKDDNGKCYLYIGETGILITTSGPSTKFIASRNRKLMSPMRIRPEKTRSKPNPPKCLLLAIPTLGRMPRL